MKFLKAFLLLGVLATPWASAVIYQDLERDAIVLDENPDVELEQTEHGYPIKRVNFVGANPHNFSARAGESTPVTDLYGIRGNCGKNNYQDIKVVDGREAIPAEFPYTVALMINTPQQGLKQLCGGSLINNQWILTAAHCLHDQYGQWRSADSITIYAGAHNVRSSSEANRQTFIGKKALYNQNYNRQTAENDIALIQLDKPAVFGKFVQPVCLSNSDPDLKQNAVLSGWGKVGTNLPQSSVLRTASMPLLRNDQCQQTFAHIYGSNPPPRVMDTMLCAGSPNDKKRSCMGDSGGPLVSFNGKAVQIGIVSWGGPSCEDSPGVYTRVNRYLSWIDRAMQR